MKRFTSLVLMNLIMLAPAAAQSFTKAVELARTYTVAIQVVGTGANGSADTRYGSGVILRSSGFIATAGHVVGDNSEWLQGSDGGLKRTIQVRIPDQHGVLEERWLSAELFKPSPSDVAIIKIKGANFKYGDCRPLQELRGTDIYRLGFTNGGQGGWADEKGGKTSVSQSALKFQGSMISQKGMSGGPAIDMAGNVLGLSINKEDDPRFPTESFTEFVRIEEAAVLLPESDEPNSCRLKALGAGIGEVIDITPRLKSFGNEATLVLNYPDQSVMLKAGDYVLDGRSLRLKAKRLVINGTTSIRSFATDTAPSPAQPGEQGSPGRQAGGDGQNGALGLQGGAGATGGTGKLGRTSGAFQLELQELALSGNAKLQIIAGGEKGGVGGKGGEGGPGGAGGAGRNRGGNVVCRSAVSPGNGGSGGKGGAGGQGGPGGRGGDGGQIVYSASLADFLVDQRLVLTAPGGLGGAGGEPGSGGVTGGGGAAGASSHCGGGGQKGPAGATGDVGGAGSAGVSGTYGDIRGL